MTKIKDEVTKCQSQFCLIRQQQFKLQSIVINKNNMANNSNNEQFSQNSYTSSKQLGTEKYQKQLMTSMPKKFLSIDQIDAQSCLNQKQQTQNCFNRKEDQYTEEIEEKYSKNKKCQNNKNGKSSKKIRKHLRKEPKLEKRKNKTQKKRNASKKSDRSKRVKDQNTCKKYHNIGIRVLQKLALGDIANKFKQKHYRQDFFIVILMIANQANKLEQFCQHYKTDVIKLKNKSGIYGSRNSKKSQLSQGIERSLACIGLYNDRKTEQARLALFNDQLRNKDFLVKSETFISSTYMQIFNYLQKDSQQ